MRSWRPDYLSDYLTRSVLAPRLPLITSDSPLITSDYLSQNGLGALITCLITSPGWSWRLDYL